MGRLVLRGVLEHLLQEQRLDLTATEITPVLLHAVGEAIADMMLDLGYRLDTEFLDGRDVVQSYLCPRTGQQLNLLGMTLVLLAGPGEAGLAVLVRGQGPSSVAHSSLGGAVRYSGTWYRQLTAAATADDLLEHAGGPVHAEIYSDHFPWPAAA